MKVRQQEPLGSPHPAGAGPGQAGVQQPAGRRAGTCRPALQAMVLLPALQPPATTGRDHSLRRIQCLLRATPSPPHREVTKAASLPASLIAGKGVARSVVTARPASVSE